MPHATRSQLRSPAFAMARLAALALLAGLAVACGTSDPDAEAAATSAGADPVELGPAPEFALADLDGNVVRIADLRGRTVVIDFWATWCAPCIFQPAELNQVFEAHRADGAVAVFGIEVSGASAEEIRAWAHENDAVAAYPILRAGDEALARDFGVLGFPGLVVVDPEGEIHSVHLGLSEAAEVEAAIEAARS